MDKIAELIEWLWMEIEREEIHLRSIAGPTGMRNSPASMMGLAKNSVRHEIIARLEERPIDAVPEPE
jgi:hypothetical protein